MDREREVLPARPRARRRYAHDLDPDPVWNWSLLLWGAPCVVVAVVLLTVAAVPALAALILAGLAWADAMHAGTPPDALRPGPPVSV